MSRYSHKAVEESLVNIRTGKSGFSDAKPGAQGILDLVDNHTELLKVLNRRLDVVEKKVGIK